MRFSLLTMITLSIHLLAETGYEGNISAKNPHYKLFNDSNLTSCSACENRVFDIETLGKSYNDINATIKNRNIRIPSIKSDSKKDAAMLNAIVKSEKSQKNIEGMKKYILEDTKYDFKTQKNDPWKKSFDTTAITSVEDMTPFKTTPHAATILAPRERLFLVVSSSMPDSVVREYLKTITIFAGNEIGVIVQGMVGGMVKMRPTVDWVKRVSNDGQYKGIDVHPDIVKTYGVDKVPALLYIKDYDPLNDNGNGITIKSKEYKIVYGAVSLEGAIRKIEETYPTKGVKKLLSRLRGEGAGFYGNAR